MATIDSTDFRVQIQPTIVTPEWDFGPSDAVAANAVLLTRENLRTMGAYPPRVGYDFDCKLHILQVIAGVETAVNLTGIAIAGTYWDWVTRVANTLTVVASVAASGELTVSFAFDDLPTAGLYEFAIKATETELFDLCSGKLEILPAVPT